MSKTNIFFNADKQQIIDLKGELYFHGDYLYQHYVDYEIVSRIRSVRIQYIAVIAGRKRIHVDHSNDANVYDNLRNDRDTYDSRPTFSNCQSKQTESRNLKFSGSSGRSSIGKGHLTLSYVYRCSCGYVLSLIRYFLDFL